jgi:transposase
MRARILDLHPGTVTKLLRLKKEAESDGVYRVARRIHAVLLNHDRYTSGEITTLLKASRARVSEWLKNYEQYGYEGLLEGYRPGRPPPTRTIVLS